MITHLVNRGIIEITGEDKASFLQGLITNDIQRVHPSKAIYSALLTPQGRFLYDFFIIEREGAYLLDGEEKRLDALLKKLDLYKLRSKVTLQKRPDLKVYALWDEREEMYPPSSYKDPRLDALGARMIEASPPPDFQSTSPTAYDLHRLRLGVPEGGTDLIPEKSILLESGLDELNGISWTKGCYMGQELTARTKYRGLVRKRLFPITFEGSPPLFGEPIFKQGQPVGEMRTHNKNYGLALLRIESLKEGQDFYCGETKLTPYIPDWMRVEEPS